ncbi:MULTISPECIES: DUF4349 domain-containing protein [unclassified Pseudoxanthomonas]|jgi:hypothetical protein|uniref:DUF4349 domain-containing protein n=1 Tax=unclassified Pseudoxanthomonas TaxID=2645906 RepID=UPI001823EB34|nr:MULTISPECIES: DUF4349 domain-containing protein [unclassified Pseudoxanthomonas]MBB3275154.1 hypothetical protein [Pseudoxanthomonas sp. OG2]
MITGKPVLRVGAGAMLALLLAAGCARHESGAAAAPASAVRNSDGAMLAYEHDVEILLEEKAIPDRLKASQQACGSGKFGQCSVLEVSQQGGDHPRASLTVRIVPEGVEPFIAQAAKGADIGSRNTRAEDLARAVGDNHLLQDRLGRERERLLEFQQRRDLAVADMIALSQQLAQVEAQLQAAQQEGAQHRHRIDTQRVTLGFVPPGGQSGRGEIRQALRDFTATLSTGTAWTIRAVAFLIPVGLVLWVLISLVRRWRRRKA